MSCNGVFTFSEIFLLLCARPQRLLGCDLPKRGEKKGRPFASPANSGRYFQHIPDFYLTYPVALIHFSLTRFTLLFAQKDLSSAVLVQFLNQKKQNLDGVLQQLTFLFEYHFIPVLCRLCSTTHGLCSTFFKQCGTLCLHADQNEPDFGVKCPWSRACFPGAKPPRLRFGLPGRGGSCAFDSAVGKSHG